MSPLSDADYFVPPDHFARKCQVPAIEHYLVCDSAFAEQAYDYGLRCEGITNASSPADALKWWHANAWPGSGYWVRDTWTGRDLFPGYALHVPQDRWAQIHSSLRPQADGTPPYFVWAHTGENNPSRFLQQLRQAFLKRAFRRIRCLDFQVAEWRPRDRDELSATVAQLRSVAAEIAPQGSVWFRGQTTSYFRFRDPAVSAFLRFPRRDISLVPSLARPGRMPEDPLEAQWWVRTVESPWRIAFLSWLMEQPGYVPSNPTARDLFDHLTDNVAANRLELAKRIDINQEFGEALAKYVHSYFLYDRPDRRYAQPFWWQQYGGATTAIDLTSDLDTAVYFARRHWNTTYNAYADGDQGSRPVIYVFAQPGPWRVNVLNSEPVGDPLIIKSEELSRMFQPPVDPPPRIHAQHSGILLGSTCYSRNHALDLVVGQISLKDFAWGTVRDDVDVFPSPGRDSFFHRLLRTKPEPIGLLRLGH